MSATSHEKEEVILEIVVNYQGGLKRIGEYQVVA